MEQETLYVGVDLGSQFHQVCVLEHTGQVIDERRIEHRALALSKWLEQLCQLAASGTQISVAIETPRSAVVEMLLERGIPVFSINPKQVDRFRDRHSVAGAKDDRRDAFVLATSLRTDGCLFREVLLGSEELVRLRALSRMHDELTSEDTALSNRIDSELLRFFPELRDVGSAQTTWFLDLLGLVAEPPKTRRSQTMRLRALLKRGHVRTRRVEDLSALLSSSSLPVAPGVADACRLHIKLLVARLRLVRDQRRECRKALDGILLRLASENHDVEIVLSLPGIGSLVGASLLSEAWQSIEQRDYKRLRALAGVAPVTKRSGKSKFVSMRRACNARLRVGVYHWARCGMQSDAGIRAHYVRLRSRGHSHGRALRGVADRLLRVLTALLQLGERFNPVKFSPETL